LNQLALLQWLHLEVTHVLQGELQLDTAASLGSLYRSVLGAALHEHSSEAFECFAGGTSDVLRPWWLWPPEVGDDLWLPGGAVLKARLSLHPIALPHLGACVQALEDFGQRGLGTSRVPAQLVNVRVWAPQGVLPLSAAHLPQARWNAAQVWQAAAVNLPWPPAEAPPLVLHARTPLRLKCQDRLVNRPPALNVVLLACMKRLQALMSLHGGARPGHTWAHEPAALNAQHKAAWLTWATDFVPEAAQVDRVGLRRWSSRQQRQMRIDGLSGAWAYAPPAWAALPWLRLAEHWQLGGKSTHGFGVLRLGDGSAEDMDSHLEEEAR
jgi:hypothetical protein